MAEDISTYAWSGQIIEPVDGIAYIGRNPGDEMNVYIATGESGNGITNGTIAGLLLTDLILGKGNPWATLYDPSRITLRAAKEFARDNLNVIAQYADYILPAEMASPKRLPAGQGAIIRHGLKKVAAYRDEHGELHEFSAMCPHLDCVVQLNSIKL